MGFEIKDGTGTGNQVHVDASNRMSTVAVTRDHNGDATIRADSYNINSGLVTITSVDEQGLLYVKNNETRDLHIHTIIVILGPSTSGVTTDTTRVRIYKNITTGTLVSEANAADTVSNRNFGSSKVLDATAYKGDASSTITDGTIHIESLIDPGSRVPFPIDEILTQGDSIAISVEANDSNTSMKAMAAIVCYLTDPNV